MILVTNQENLIIFDAVKTFTCDAVCDYNNEGSLISLEVMNIAIQMRKKGLEVKLRDNQFVLYDTESDTLNIYIDKSGKSYDTRVNDIILFLDAHGYIVGANIIEK